ncbi:sugar phosphorylase [Pontibacillus yanchengensis]|uniref:Sucrose phosphorylase n=1 Tax=Pontibacillus yanchengensis Y32 TaxID=1385514 RepID=A0A0A2TX51_9BACI|nr:sugar phosphorylase [Pontibacillus yanchengensis]KGP73820.1 alpha-amylase [Pontibacillus yanchengensis Y32]
MNRDQVFTTLKEQLQTIYGSEFSEQYLDRFNQLFNKWEKKDWASPSPLTEENVYLITYGDSIYEEGKPTLPTLQTFLNKHVGNHITDVHLLPMFPYTSDDGFSVSDYRRIHPTLGDWEDIQYFSKDYRLMFDFVANHISKSSDWFQGYLNGDPQYQHYFIPKTDNYDTSQFVRPRTSPLFHEYEAIDGTKTALTTFSEDQVDVNFHHFPVLVEMTDILLYYAHQGGTSIRLDAIGFIWKKSGSTSMHLPEAHAIVQLWHTVLNYFKPNTQIITETNVPHEENISYLGDGTNEANMVYQFTLPPLVLYTLTTQQSDKLTSWAKTIDKVSESATFFNFLASHDGIGMRPTEGILTNDEKQLLVDKVQQNGGQVSFKNNPDGTQSVYELNINYSEALPNDDEQDTETKVQKMLASHAILLSFIGVPAIYYHSLLGSYNHHEGVHASGMNRRINREKFQLEQIEKELVEDKKRHDIFTNLKSMIAVRQQEKAFSPYAEQEVLELGPNLFGLKRQNEETGDTVYFMVNVTNQHVASPQHVTGTDLMTGKGIEDYVTLSPYAFIWIKA